MPSLSDLAADHQRRRNVVADRTVTRSLRLWREMSPMGLDVGWDQIAPELVDVVSTGQVTAAGQASPYLDAIGGDQLRARLAVGSFAGVTREGREVGPELFSAVTTTKRLIGGGAGFPAAFRAGAAFMAVLVGTIVRDAGRSADSTIGIGRGFTYNVRVVQPGACSRCAILAGVKGYRADFQRHPLCRCTSMPLRDDTTPKGFYRSADHYFDSLSESEQDRVFTKAGAESIRLGADPAKVVNSYRGHTRPVGRPPLIRSERDRYRVTGTFRRTPRQLIQSSTSPDNARELLRQYGYLR